MTYLDDLAAEAADEEWRTHRRHTTVVDRLDKLWETCARCGLDWPCPQAHQTDPKETR